MVAAETDAAAPLLAPCTIVGALMLRDGSILLGRRSGHKTYAHLWDVPGGHVEAGESLDQALCRELDEELGVVVTACEYHSVHVKPGFVLHLLVVTAWEGEPEANNDEHSEVRWYNLGEACALGDLAASEYVEVFRSLIQRLSVPPHANGQA